MRIYASSRHSWSYLRIVSVLLSVGTILSASTPTLVRPATAAALPAAGLWAQTEILSNADSAREGYFGGIAALASDGGTVVVGAPSYSSGHLHGGAVYVYERSAPSWASSSRFGARLTVSDAADGDRLGATVAISADGGTIVAGAPNSASGGNGRGAVYVYTHLAGGWQTSSTFSAQITLADALDLDFFGSAVAVSADGSTVGACTAERVEPTVRTAACYVFQRSSSGWASTNAYAARLSLSDPMSNPSDLAIAMSADGATIVVGALSHALPHVPGKLYVFVQPAGPWQSSMPTARLSVDNAALESTFGVSVAISADSSTIVGGAPDQNSSSGSGGAGYLYRRPAGGWATTGRPNATLTLANAQVGDQLGHAVTLSADGSTAVLGAPMRAGRGAAALYQRPIGGWSGSITEHALLTLATPSAYTQNLGATVAISADGGTVLAGEPNGTQGVGTGSVLVYQRPPAGWVSTADAANLQPSAWYGDGSLFSLAVSADGSTIVVGSGQGFSYGSNGAIYIYEKDPAGWRRAAQVTMITSAGGANLNSGAAVALSANGDTLVVGSERRDSTNTRGTVLVYRRPPGGWVDMLPTAHLTTTDQGGWDGFGTALSISSDGQTIVASAPAHATGGVSGVIYVYREPLTGWADMTETARLSVVPRTNANRLGQSVAVSGDGQTIVATAPDSVVGSSLHSAAYLFLEPQSGWVTTTAAMAQLDTALASPAVGSSAVAINPDGRTVVVGCTGGRVLVFQRQGSAWLSVSPIALLTRSDASAQATNIELYSSVAISSDGQILLLGVDESMLSSTARGGATYVYTQPSAGWMNATESLHLNAPGEPSFGWATAIGGDRRMIVVGARDALELGSAFVYERPNVQIFAPYTAH